MTNEKLNELKTKIFYGDLKPNDYVIIDYELRNYFNSKLGTYYISYEYIAKSFMFPVDFVKQRLNGMNMYIFEEDNIILCPDTTGEIKMVILKINNNIDVKLSNERKQEIKNLFIISNKKLKKFSH